MFTLKTVINVNGNPISMSALYKRDLLNRPGSGVSSWHISVLSYGNILVLKIFGIAYILFGKFLVLV